jgi:hypothetical protein
MSTFNIYDYPGYSNITIDGLSTYGFWMPLVFWSIVAVFLFAIAYRGHTLSVRTIITSVLTVAGLSVLDVMTEMFKCSNTVGRFVISGHFIGAVIGAVAVFSIFPLFSKVSVIAATVMTYFALLIADTSTALTVNVPGIMHTYSWAPTVLAPHIYTAQMSWVGGAGLRDALLTSPVIFAAALIFVRLMLSILAQEHRRSTSKRSPVYSAM